MFRRYDHVERIGHDEVEGLVIGDNIYVYTKLDGTNASIWMEQKEYGPVICCGSRNRELSEFADNLGFWHWVNKDENQEKFQKLFITMPQDWTLYGEWLVPHTLNTYRDEVWRRFWIFDVYDRSKGEYVNYDRWAHLVQDIGLDHIQPLVVMSTPSEAQLRLLTETNTDFIKDGCGAGEGIVIKNYEWRNSFGRQPWAKIVRNEFKEDNRKAFGPPERDGEFQVEAAIAEDAVTLALVNKTRAKIETDLLSSHPAENLGLMERELSPMSPDMLQTRRAFLQSQRHIIIPRLLETVYYEVIREELWTAIKKYQFPIVNFKLLKVHVIHWTKKYAKDLF